VKKVALYVPKTSFECFQTILNAVSDIPIWSAWIELRVHIDHAYLAKYVIPAKLPLTLEVPVIGVGLWPLCKD
jgi:hypothetical protein